MRNLLKLAAHLGLLLVFLGSLTASHVMAAQQGGWGGTPTVPPTPTPGPGSDETCPEGSDQGPAGIKADVIGIAENGDPVIPWDSIPKEKEAPLPIPTGSSSRRLYSSKAVNTVGDVHYAFSLGAATSVVGMPIRFSLHYRSDATLPTCEELNSNWHLDLLDKVIVTETAPGEFSIRWITGSGDLFEYGLPSATGTTPNVTEYWYQLPGYALAQFRFYNAGTGWTLERYNPSGHVMRYESTGSGATTNWRPKYYYDSFDNVTTYTYNTGGALHKIADPRGLEIEFAWTSTSCAVTYHYPGLALTALDRSFGIDATTKRVTTITYPKSEYVTFANTTDKLVDLSSVFDVARVLTFSYASSHGLLESLVESRANGTMTKTLWTLAYASQGGRYRITSATDVYGLTQTWTNRSFGSNNVLQSYRWTEPVASGQTASAYHDYTVDDKGRILTDKITAGANAKPRSAAGDSPSEPSDLTWTYTYGTCACPKPTSVVTPTGATFSLTWDASLNKITSLTMLNPTGTGNVTRSWTWKSFLEQGLPSTYTAPSGGASLTYSYNLVNRSAGLSGKKIDYWKVETSTITHPDGSHTLTTEQWLDTLGRPVQRKDVGGTNFYASYFPTGQAGAGFLKEVSRETSATPGDVFQVTSYVVNDLGWVTREDTASGSLMLRIDTTRDAVGRVKSVSSESGAGQPASIREIYRDAWGNVVVERKKNLDYQGQAQKYEDGTGNGRTWVRNEWHYDYERLLESYLDRRSLAEGEDFTNIDTGTNPWMVRYAYGYRSDDGTLQTVTLPNGSTNEFVVDGYGTLYKIIGDVGGANLDLGRSYYDNDLVLSQARKRLTSTTTAAWTITRNHSGLGYPVEAQDPTGVISAVTYDALGRVVQSTVRSGSNPIQRKTTFEYDVLGRMTKRSRALLNGAGSGPDVDETSFIYNKRSQILRTEGSLSRKTFREYDAVGRLKLARDFRSTTTTECDEVELSYTVGRDLVAASVSKIWEDVSGATARKEYRTEYTYDAFGRVIQVSNKGLNGTQTALTRSYAYDTLGNLTNGTDPLGKPTRAVFDADGRWVESVLKESSSGSAAKIKMTSTYSDKVSGSNATYRVRYDGKGYTTKEQFDALYRLARVERPGFTSGSAHRTELTYDSVSGRLSSLKDGNDSIVDQVFDSAGRLLRRDITPGAGVSLLATQEKFEYDALGVMKRMETRQQTGAAYLLGAVDLTTDTLDRLTKESFTYWGIDTNFPVDISSGYTIPGGSTEDPHFRRTLNYGASGLALEMTPDAIGRIDKIKATPAGGTQFEVAAYRWAGSQPMERLLKYGPGSTPQTQRTAFGYDDYRRLKNIDDFRGGSSTAFSHFEFEWDAGGRLLKEFYFKVQGGGGDQFNYDGFDRVVGVKYGVTNMSTSTYSSATGVKEVTYGLDPGNSRSSMTETVTGQPPAGTSYATFANNYRYESIIGTGGATPLYDNEGNLAYDGRYYYVYDFKNRLSEIWVASAGSSAMSSQQRVASAQQKGASTVRASKRSLEGTRKVVLDRFGGKLSEPIKSHKSLQPQGLLDAQGTTENSTTYTLSLVAVYGYDPMNRRILRVIAGGEDYRYAYDRWREVEEVTPDASSGIYKPFALKSFVWGSRIDELVSYRLRTGLTTWAAYYPAQGKMDNVVALSDEAGNTVERVEYDAYGKASVFVGSSTTPQDFSSVLNPYLFQGRRLDWETGFMYLRNRYLHTGWGRFLTNDPIGSWSDSANFGNGVAFAGNDSASGSDPMGLHCLPMGVGSGGGIPESFHPGGDNPGFVPPGSAEASGSGEPESPAQTCPRQSGDPVKYGPFPLPSLPGGGRVTSVLPSGDSVSFDVPDSLPVGSEGTIEVGSNGDVDVEISAPGSHLDELASAGIDIAQGVASLNVYANVAIAGHDAYQGNYLAAGLAFVPFEKIWKAVKGAGRLGWTTIKVVTGCAARVIWKVKGCFKRGAKKIASRGSTGRTIPSSLKEKLAMEQVMSKPGGVHLETVPMTDPRWLAEDGWIKMAHNVNGVEIHYVYNIHSHAVDDFKFK